MTVVAPICLAVLALAAVACVVRLLRADSFADRIVATDLLLGVVVAGVGVQAAATGSDLLLNLLVVTALLGFIATVTVARFMEHRGS